MHVIGLLLIIILIYLAIVHWYITVPLLLFLVYLGYIYIPQKPKKHPVRFHTLWWIFMLCVVTLICNRENIHDFYRMMNSETRTYQDREDPLVEHAIAQSDGMLTGIGTQASPSQDLYGGLTIGMSPFQVTWRLTLHPELDSDFTIDNVRLFPPNRHYFDNRLYGISFGISNDTCKISNARTVVRFLSKKYGEPHHCTSTDTLYQALWQFTDKHILVKCLPNEYTNTLYLFHPIPLLQKIEAVHQKELDEEAEEKQREAEIAAIIAERERLKEEQQRQKELLNQKLQESL